MGRERTPKEKLTLQDIDMSEEAQRARAVSCYHIVDAVSTQNASMKLIIEKLRAIEALLDIDRGKRKKQ